MKKFVLILVTILGVNHFAFAQYYGYMPPAVMTDPCVQASIAVANSSARIYQQGAEIMAMQAMMAQNGYFNSYGTYSCPMNSYGSAYDSSYSSSYESSSYESRYGDVECHSCHGTGVCSTCNGKGWFYSDLGGGRIKCPNCVHNDVGKCSTCFGRGTVYGLK